MLTLLSLDARRSSVKEREPFARAIREWAAPEPSPWQSASRPIPLVTCNRVELIGCCDAPDRDVTTNGAALTASLPADLAERFTAIALRYDGDAAAEHLLRVTAGLESQVEGDVQVLGQVRSAYAAAANAWELDAALHRLFQTALRAGKRVRHETALGRRDASVGTAAADYLVRRLDGDGGRVLLLGAGSAAERAARALRRAGLTITIVNRDRDRAGLLASAVGAAVGRFEDRYRLLAETDAAILATGASEAIVLAEPLAAALHHRTRLNAPLLLIDLGMPRNAATGTGQLPGVQLIGLQDIPGITVNDPAARDAAARIIAEELQSLRTWATTRRATPIATGA